MRMNRMAALTLSAGLFTMAACSDAPTAAPSAAALPKTPSLVVGVPFAGPAPTAEVGKIVLCKVGNIGGAFDFTETPEGPAQDPNGAVANDMSLNAGQCVEVAIDNSPDGSGNQVQIHELDPLDPSTTTQVVESCKFRSKNPDGTTNPEVDCEVYADNQKLFLNAFHGFVVTYRNTFTEPPPPPPDVCDFSTFGGFVLLPNNISYGGNAGFASSGFAYGSLNFKNHTNGDHIHVWNVTDYGHPADGPLSQYEDSRLAFGLASVNGGPVNVPVEWRFVDLGEPAKKVGDAVYLKVGNTVLIPEQVVIGGNIQLHAKCKKAPKAEKH